MNETNSTYPKFGPSAQAIAYSQLTFLVLLLLSIVPLTIWRRNLQPLKARNPLLVLITFLLYFFPLIVNCLYVGIGPEKYPCQLHVFTYAYAPLCVAVNTFKSFRLLLELILANTMSSEVPDTPEDQAKKARSIYLLRIATSKYFGFLIIAVLFMIHTGVYIVDVTVVSTMVISCKLDAPGLIVFKYWLLIQFLAPIPIYLIIMITSWVVMLVKKLNDTWSIRFELFLMPLYYVPLFITFAITWWFNYLWYEYYSPSALFIWIAGNLDIFINICFPILKTFTVRRYYEKEGSHGLIEEPQKEIDNPQETSPNSLRATLNDDALRKEFLKFTTASLCPESLLFWIDTKLKYEVCKDETRAVSLAWVIYKQYINDNGIMELNLDGKAKNVFAKQILQSLKATEKEHSPLSRKLFYDLILHVEIDLQDSFSRFILTREYETLSNTPNKLRGWCCSRWVRQLFR